MFCFYMAPGDYRKIFFSGPSLHFGRDKSLLSCFPRVQARMVPPDVDFRELNSDCDKPIVCEARA